MKMRGQTSLEFFLSYGWMILLLVVALGFLAVLGVFNLSNYSGNGCVPPSDFSCLSYSLSTTGNLILNLQQNTQFPINVTQVGCNANQTLNGIVTQAPAVYMTIGSNATFTVACHSGSSTFTGPVGTKFLGYVVINYTDVYTNLPTVVYGKLDVPIS